MSDLIRKGQGWAIAKGTDTYVELLVRLLMRVITLTTSEIARKRGSSICFARQVCEHTLRAAHLAVGCPHSQLTPEEPLLTLTSVEGLSRECESGFTEASCISLTPVLGLGGMATG